METQNHVLTKEDIKAAAKAYVREDPLEYRLWKLTPGTVKTIKGHFKAGVKWAKENHQLPLSEQIITDEAKAYAISEIGESLLDNSSYKGHYEATTKDFTRVFTGLLISWRASNDTTTAQ